MSPKEKESRHHLRKPILNKCVYCRLCIFILVFSCAASVYFAFKYSSHHTESREPVHVPYLYTKLEGVQPEERDVFQDFRTSFLPLDEVVVRDPAAFTSRSKRYIAGSNETSRKIWLGMADLSRFPGRVKRTGRLPARAEDGIPPKSEDDFSPPEDAEESENGAEDDSKLEEDSADGYYDEYEDYDDAAASVSKEAGSARRPEDRGPLDDVAEQVRAQPELEEGELATVPLLYHSPHRYTGIHAFWKGQGDKETIRHTQASIMRQYMDAGADPCEDFFQYACGNWPVLNPIPADKAGYDTFEILRENLDTMLRDLLEFKPDELYVSEYPGPNLDLYDNFLTQIQKPDPINTEIATTVLFLDHKRDKRSRLQRAELLHRIRRYFINNNDDATLFNTPKRKITEFDANLKRSQVEENNKTKYLFKKPKKSSNIRYYKSVNKRVGRQLKFQRKKKIKGPIIELGEKTTIIEKDDDPTGGDAALKARFLFKSCMNNDILQKRGHQPLLDLLELLGGWPILTDNWNASKFDWIELMANLRLYNNDILISEWVGPDIKNSDEFVIQFDQTSLGLPTRDYFLQDSNKAYLTAYKDYLIKICLLMGGEHERVYKSANELIEFETSLAKITSAPEDRRNVSELYRRMSLRRLEDTVPGVRWRRYLSVVMNRTVQQEENVVLFALKYVQNLVRLINKTEPSTVSNYLLWRFVRHRVNNLDDRFQQAKQQFYNVLFGREQAPPRWKNCISQVNSNMGMALGSMFVRKYFDETSKNDTLTMTRDIQQSFRELLALTDWIDDDTKRLAAHKVDAMMLRIGYPDFILKKKELNDRYKEVLIHPDKYFENILNILQHLTKMEQARLGQPVNKTLWNTAPAVVNAYYSRNKNQIMFPAGILQPPFYHRHFPKSLNYGGIGVVIGHEITHGFDDKGRLFDSDGNLHRWWSDSAVEAFHKRAQCLIDQYGRYVVPEVRMKLDGVNTQGENIADNGGVKQAFRAYQRWLRQQGETAMESERMPGLNHTHKQLFFLNFAQVWCGSLRPEAMRNKLKTAVHSPGRFRVIGALSNSEDFAREFSCKPGSTMNPITKCNVW